MTLQNMAPSAKRSFLLTAILGGLAVAIYLFAVEPTQLSLLKARAKANDLAEQYRRVTTDLANASAVEKRLDEIRASLQPFQEALIVPLLESTAMRAKSILDPLALGAGLRDLEYEALSPRALPVPKRRLPNQLYARQPIRLVAQGSYQAAVSFLLRVEKELPYVTLESFVLTVQANPNAQKVEMILEWPAKGAVTRK